MTHVAAVPLSANHQRCLTNCLDTDIQLNIGIHMLRCLQGSHEVLTSLMKAVNLEDECSKEDKITILAPSNAAFDDVAGVISTLEYSTLVDVRSSSSYLSFVVNSLPRTLRLRVS